MARRIPRLGRISSKPQPTPLAPNPLWYKDALVYELHLRAFADSNGDGIGDLGGLIGRLDYLHDLGVTALWLLPFYPSPLRDGGYDIADYTSINPAYGTLREFKQLLREAHRRGIRVITELVLNHTSNEHAWFQRARRAPPGSRWRNFYVWSDTPDRYREARIIFKDFETSNWSWDPVAKAYYWHRFYSHQPDLNYANPEVHRAMLKVVDFWMDLGVDGLRLDAVPYLYEREGTNCENLPETHAFLRQLREHVDARYRDRLLLAEANQWPEDAAAYFGQGGECHMNFHFPLMPRMFMAVHLEDRFPIVDILRQTPAIPEGCQWATFLRNHDELTLEMVTDEDRDYMYRVYAEDPYARINLGIRRRLAPLLQVRRKIELMNALLFSLPGTPVLYYGDEIGMGDNIYLGDRDGVRTPMQWSADRNAGFSTANPQKLYLPVVTDPEYHYEAVNVQAQQQNPSSLLWWMKRLIALRKQHPVFGHGALEFVPADNHKVLAFVRGRADDRVLVCANLSRFPQYAELDLSAYAGMVPVEMFGRVRFPAIGSQPYMLTFGPHSFYWFALEPPPSAALESRDREPPLLDAPEPWRDLLHGSSLPRLERLLVNYAAARRWFRGKARTLKAGHVTDVITLGTSGEPSFLVFLTIDYLEGEPETYVLGLSVAHGHEARTIAARSRHAIIARLPGGDERILHDSLASGSAVAALAESIQRRATLAGDVGQLQGIQYRVFRELAGTGEFLPHTSEFEQTNTTVVLGDRLLIKVFRLVEPGPSPEVEIGCFLTERAKEVRTPRIAGALQYRRGVRPPAVLGTVQEFVPNEGVAWQVTLAALERYCERVLAADPSERPQIPVGSIVEQTRLEPPAAMHDLLGTFPSLARLLGKRTAELHLALGRGEGDPAFAPESFSTLYQQSLFQWAHTMLMRTCETLSRRRKGLPEEAAQIGGVLLERASEVDARLREISSRKIETLRIRCHGDLHLGQILFTGSDFVIIDFEGEPARPLNERRYKRSPLRDVTGLLRSFHYATEAVLRDGRQRPEDVETLGPWLAAWRRWISAACLGTYLQTMGATPTLPATDEDKELLLGFYMLEKCIYEIGYELNNRPDWLIIPLRGLHDLMRW